MNCTKCGHDVVSCIDSRPKNGTIYRRRKCLQCGYRFSSVEVSLEALEGYKANEKLLAGLLDHAADVQTQIKERKNIGGKRNG